MHIAHIPYPFIILYLFSKDLGVLREVNFSFSQQFKFKKNSLKPFIGNLYSTKEAFTWGTFFHNENITTYTYPNVYRTHF